MHHATRILLVVGTLLVSSLAIQATTAQDPNVHQFQQRDARITWTGGTDNEVQVRIEGNDLPTTVIMRDSNGNWARMRDVSGDFNNDHLVKSGYLVEPGNHVWFELGWSVPKSWIEETSCAYNHRTFTRDCSVQMPPLPPVDLQFAHLGGNEWWIEVRMSGKSVESLDEHSLYVLDDQGDTSFLKRLSETRWGVGMRVPLGTRVMYEATVPERDPLESCWFVHPTGEKQCDGHKLPPDVRERRVNQDGSVSVWSSIESFEHFKVNEWWVEVQVKPYNNQHWDWQRAEVRVNGGAWKAMTLRSWGSWAVSTHVPQGSLLQFRAYDGIDKTWMYSTGTWSGWGSAPKHVPSLDPAWDVAFNNIKGNNWWVQVNPISDEYFSRVQARVEGGEWRELKFYEWGDWAASFHVPTGKRVQFQVLHEWDESNTRVSGWTTWPPQ